MGLSANMWASVSGLLMHGEKMGVIGNNIANISTIGFKSQRMDFEDFIYQDSFSASGPTQMGRGVGVSAIMGDFSQGGIETTNDPTDLLISGSGFFQVKDPFSDQVNYTRAGNFRFDNEGVLRTPSGYALQGWEIPDSSIPDISINGKATAEVAPSALQGTGNPKDIRFNSTILEPRQTTYAEMTVNLNNADVNDKSSDETNPMFSLFNAWDGNQLLKTEGQPPIALDAYMYPSTMTVYDEGGAARVLTTYFDKIDSSTVKNLPGGYQVYEYLLTMDPAEDVRTYGGKYNATTGILEDDLDSWTDYASAKMSASAVGTNPTFSEDKTLAKAAIVNALNAEITRLDQLIDPTAPASALTEDDINVASYPSGGWYLDPYDANVKRVLDAAAATTPPTTNTDITILKNASTRDEDIFVDATTGDPVVPDPLDANVVKNMSETDSAGVLMMGTMVFNAAGQLISQSAYTYNGDTELDPNEVSNSDPSHLENWEPAPVSSNGYAVFTANFGGHPLANSPRQNAELDNKIDTKDSSNYLIEFNLGMKSNILNQPWKNENNAATVGTDYSDIALYKNSERTNNTSTAYDASNSSNSPIQDGYKYGSLSNYHVDQGGILYGIYSNGITKPLYQVAIYDFTNTQGLRREGGNFFSATEDSGQPRVGPAGQNGLGTIDAYAIEQSNVDMSREFVQMISTQRGYQANSKSITTTDSMLETVINIVR